MSDWGSGYVTDVEYAMNFHREQSPGVMGITCLLNGIRNPDFDRGFSYCELGCGTGITLLVLAATNPQGRFVGVDFNPVHIAFARDAASAAGLTNVEFIESSFEDLVHTGDGAHPMFDVIALHGVYSWVSEATRRAIVAVLAKRLSPGGLAYLSYNSMPERAMHLPLQRLLRDLALLRPGRSDERFKWAAEQVAALYESNVPALKNAAVEAFLRNSKVMDVRYLAHEYLNEHWEPMYHADVVRDLAAAKMTYVGSASLLFNFPDLRVSSEQAEILARINVPGVQETLRDFCGNRGFREDVFVRGPLSISNDERSARLRNLLLALVVNPDQFKFEMNVGPARGSMNQDTYRPLVAALAEGPKRVGELLDLATRNGNTGMTPIEIVGVLVGTEQALPVSAAAERAQAASDRLNLVLLSMSERMHIGNRIGLAVPALGTGLHADVIGLKIFESLIKTGRVSMRETADSLVKAWNAKGIRLAPEGKPLETEAEQIEYMGRRVREITDGWMPVWYQFWPQFRSAQLTQ
jgi:SAM-dependent methyltransferase